MSILRKASSSTISLLTVGTIAALAAAAPASAASAASASKCEPLTSRQVWVGHSRADRHQQKVINTFLRLSTSRGASFRVQVSILAAGMQESGLRELRYGHGTSLGPLQLISIHGRPDQRERADFSANWYLPQAVKIDAAGTTVAEIAVRVQRPANRSHYKHMIETKWKKSALKMARIYRKGCAS